MKEDNQLKILELIDDGATLESSSELKALVEESDEATEFYKSILAVSYTHLTLPTSDQV